MKIESIMEAAEKALHIDECNLAKESLDTPKIYGRMLRIRTEESMVAKKLTYDLKQLYQVKRDYYLGRAEPEVYKAKPFDTKILKSEVDAYIQADQEIVDLSTRIEIQEEKIHYLDGILKQISNRGFLIKNAIDFNKLMNGGF